MLLWKCCALEYAMLHLTWNLRLEYCALDAALEILPWKCCALEMLRLGLRLGNAAP
jgi:hypothetical protein